MRFIVVVLCLMAFVLPGLSGGAAMARGHDLVAQEASAAVIQTHHAHHGHAAMTQDEKPSRPKPDPKACVKMMLSCCASLDATLVSPGIDRRWLALARMTLGEDRLTGLGLAPPHGPPRSGSA